MPVLASPAGRTVVLRRRALGVPWLVASAKTASSTLNSKAVSVPTGTADGDIMLGFWVESVTTGTTDVDFSTQGWTLLATHTPSSSRARIYWKLAFNEPASYTTHYTAGTVTWETLIVTFRDVDRINPIDTSTINNGGSTTTATATSLTTSNPLTMLVMAATTAGGRNFTASTLTELIDDNTTPGFGIFNDTQNVGGASGNKTATISGSAFWYASLIALRPRNGA